ncbi:FAD-dependent oxidoreductase [Burkholderia sp. Ac-20344]|nr:FAD-dependent oxidoreductase [Burkholderia sp. Ac-20344]
MKYEIGILGGGFTGLLLAQRMRAIGIRVVCFRHTGDVREQSQHCQGILHTGLKYLDMPTNSRLKARLRVSQEIWRREYLAENGVFSVPRNCIRRVSYLFHDCTTSRLSDFLSIAHDHAVAARAALSGNCNRWSTLGFHGAVVETSETALDTSIFREHTRSGIDDQLASPDGWRAASRLPGGYVVFSNELTVECDYLIVAAGAQTSQICADLGMNVRTKRRPIRSASVSRMPFPTTLHIFRPNDVRPYITISSALKIEGWVWSVGGELMSSCTNPDVLQELLAFFPNLDLRHAQCKIDVLDRIEPDDGRPDVAEDGLLATSDGLLACIPTKMTLIPTFFEPIVRSYQLHQQNRSASCSRTRP